MIPLANLDDHTYASLVEEAISQIPVEYPEWTDHNPTDTGIILIELLAWLTEMTLYRVNQIPDENYASFISLLKGEEWKLPIDVSTQERKQSLQLEIQNTLLKLRHRYRAITSEDFENLILIDWNQSEKSQNLKIARVKCFAQRNPESRGEFAKGHITLVVLPEENSQINQDKYETLRNFLDERKLLTTRLHIVEPEYVFVSVEVELVLQDGAQPEEVKKQAKTEVKMFFEPLRSGKYWQGKGWYFGRSVYQSELYKLFDDLEGVDYIENLQIKDDSNTSVHQIDIAENQLITLKDSIFTILVQVGNERKKI
jgi:hypothetical protein